MNVPGIPVPVRVPVAHNDRPPEGWEAEVFTYAPANTFTEQFVGVDLVTARRYARVALDAFKVFQSFPQFP